MTAQIDLTQIVNIGNDIIDPQNLLCSLCCCIRLDLVQCKNNKCDKVYCEPCIKESNKFKDICPFCQLNVGYKRCDDKVYKILENLSLICQDNNCKETFTISKYFYHKKITNHKETTCIKCNNVELKLSKCYLCNNNYCSNCTNFISCFNCKSIICNTCNKNSNKGINNETLCGNCSRDCFLCKEESINICIFCQKSLCGKCSYHCKTCDSIMCLNTCYANKNYLNDCKICNGIINNNNMNNTYNNCIHKQLLSCNNCNKKCQRISKINCKELLASNTCSVCKFEVCNKNCSLKCKSCKDIYCKTCSGFCAICKTSYCDSCVLKCYNCEEFNSSCCKNCKPDIFKNCLTCNKLLCINCWNLCNYCNAIFCKIHIEKCLDCQESCCKEHFYTCKVCNNKEDKYKKHCLHKCTLKCDFCDVISSINCNKSKHSIVTKFNCGHNVCSECVKKCGKCKTIVMSCRKCINNYYFISCKNCDIYLCSSCSKSCKNCNDKYFSTLYKK